jgi:DNA-binding winged helix-turn-helix (wHTH) protein
MTYRFGRFSIDDQERILLRDGVVVPVTRKAADLLLLLLSRPGHVYDKQQILDALWRDSFVEEGSIAQNVSQLRKILGDSADNPTYIETIPKRGYRWLAPLNEAPEVHSPPAPKQPRVSRRIVFLSAAAAVCAALAVLLTRGGSAFGHRANASNHHLSRR